MDAPKRVVLPLYLKYFFTLANVMLTASIFVMGSFIISPLLSAFVVAILLKPLCAQLEKHKIPKPLSAAFSVILFALVILMLISFVTAQIAAITSDPLISADRLDKALSSLQGGTASLLGISRQVQTKYIAEGYNSFLKNIVAYFPNAISGTAGYLTMFLLFFISLFFFLYYRNFFLSFIYKLFGKNKEEQVGTTVLKIQDAVINYIVGLFYVMVLLASFNTVGLVILGIPHAIFFGILGALLSIIPYVGIIIGSLVPAIFALFSMDSLWYAVGVIFVFGFVQFLEGNFITPNIIGSRENINPYIAVLGLFIGGMLIGAVGVILAIPLLGILKIIFDDTEFLKPIGYVMGNPQRPKEPKWYQIWLPKNKK